MTIKNKFLRKEGISVILALMLILSILPVGGLTAFAGSEHSHCVCGEEHSDIGSHTAEDELTFTEWTETTSLPTTAGNYYLSDNVTLTETWNVPDGTVLCLNGKTITANGIDGVIFNVAENYTLTITDCAGTGCITGKAQGYGHYASGAYKVNYNKCIFMKMFAGSVFNMYGGTISGIRCSDSDYQDDCLLIRGEGSSIVNMFGGAITNNGSRPNGQYAMKYSKVESVIKSCTFNVYGGTISGNAANNGGVFNSCTVNINDGTISGNSANNGGVFYGCTVNMKNGVISNNSAGTGGVFNNCTVVIDNGTISGNSSNDDAGVAYRGSITLNDGTISGNSAADDGAVSSQGIIILNGGTISGNSAVGDGGVVEYGTLTVNDGTISGNKAYRGGVIFGGTFNMTGGVITGNSATITASVYGNYATIGGTAVIKGNVNGGTYNNETGLYTGGTEANVYLYDNDTIKLTSSTADIGVTKSTAPVDGTPVQITSSDCYKYIKSVKSDNADYSVVIGDNGSIALAIPDDTMDSAKYGASLALYKDITVKIKVSNADEDFNSNKLAIYAGDSVTTTEKVAIKKVGDVYCADVDTVTAASMATPAHIAIKYNGVTIKEFDFSVKDYCDAVIAKETDETYTEEVKELCNAALVYGSWSQKYVAEQAKTTVDDDKLADVDVDETYKANVLNIVIDEPEEVKKGIWQGCNPDSAYLSIGSDVTIKFRFTSDDVEKYDFTVNGEKVTVGDGIEEITDGGKTVYETSFGDFGAYEFSTKFPVIQGGTSYACFAYGYSVNDYCYTVTSDEDGTYSDTLVNLCKAMYNYGVAAEAYVGGLSV